MDVCHRTLQNSGLGAISFVLSAGLRPATADIVEFPFRVPVTLALAADPSARKRAALLEIC